ncbi:hypothetical protein F1D05_05855 [Kribbella qitaiheensis]|uniref:DUF222 domain-containing protein n=1 Tax=Kribbella qitaiheensis TaxID=1544730 RepID=A0A7G6WU53_9ACTN|nr:hypothetical protein [Kribbella qitaiheensis]QNE17518.1 hypothetical protein F1D05_05855 [Kribbella qitaiheensis]
MSIDFSSLDAAQTLARASAAHELQRRSELELILLAQHYAHLHPSSARVRDDGLPGGEQTKVYGGEGCPEIAEFAVAEFGVVTGRSAGSAAKFIGQAVALPYRFPLTWKQVESGEATGWKALHVVQECVTLSVDAAAIVDRRVADIIDSVTFLQLRKIIKAATWEADPDAAKAAAEATAKERGVWVGRTDDHGTATLFIKGATGDIIQLKATITQLADALAALGDTDTLDQRRAKAAGLLSDPGLAADLLSAAARHLVTAQANTGHPAPATATATLEPESAPEADLAWTARSDNHPDEADRSSCLAEPGLDDEADRDTPHPAIAGHPLDPPHPGQPVQPAEVPGSGGEERRSSLRRAPEAGEPAAPADHPACPGMDPAARLELRRKLDAIRQDHPDTRGRRIYQTVVNLHITDETLLAGQGTARVEGYGPVYTDRLEELLGHHRVVVRPVIDLNNAISVHAYEIPGRFRDHLNLRYPVEQFPYGTGETTRSTDLDHIQPYRTAGPPGQTNTDNLAPLRRFSHRLKTHGDWRYRRVDHLTLEWTTPHGYVIDVDHNGTHRALAGVRRRRAMLEPPPLRDA